MSWGESIGLQQWNKSLRSNQYPPKSIVEAIRFAECDFVRNAYKDAERLVEYLIRPDENPGSPVLRLLSGNIKRLPPWAITWPAGQLSTIGRSGKYVQNLQRYNEVFSRAFGPGIPLTEPGGHSDGTIQTSAGNQTGIVHIVPLESQSDAKSLRLAIRPFLLDVSRRCAHRRKISDTKLVSCLDRALDRFCKEGTFEATRRNSSVITHNPDLEPIQEELEVMDKYFEAEVEWYNQSIVSMHMQRIR